MPVARMSKTDRQRLNALERQRKGWMKSIGLLQEDPIEPECRCGHQKRVHNLIWVDTWHQDTMGMCWYCECEDYRGEAI